MTTRPPSADRPRSTAAAGHRRSPGWSPQSLPRQRTGRPDLGLAPSADHDRARRAPRSTATAAARRRPGNSDPRPLAAPAPRRWPRVRRPAGTYRCRDLPPGWPMLADPTRRRRAAQQGQPVDHHARPSANPAPGERTAGGGDGFGASIERSAAGRRPSTRAPPPASAPRSAVPVTHCSAPVRARRRAAPVRCAAPPARQPGDRLEPGRGLEVPTAAPAADRPR